MDGVLLEVCWRMRGRSGCIFTCRIFVTAPNLLEVAVTRGDGRDVSIVFSQIVKDIEVARKLAECWRQTVLARGTFNELLN